MALDTTVGGADADSYADLDFLATYVLARAFVPSWYATSTSATKEAAMRQAARMLDALFVWTGSAVDETQALTWPRTGMFTRNGYAIAETVIPADLKKAQCEFALQIGAGDKSADNDAIRDGITSVKAGSVAVTFSDPEKSTREAADIAARLKEYEMQWASRNVPDAVRQLLVASWYTAATVSRPLLFGAL